MIDEIIKRLETVDDGGLDIITETMAEVLGVWTEDCWIYTLNEVLYRLAK